MSDVTKIAAQPRVGRGKGGARAVRRAGFVPGVIYGKKQDPVLVQMDPRPLLKLMHQPGFAAQILEVEVEGGDSYTVLPKDVQFDPVTDIPVHFDFLRFSEDDKVTVAVPVEFLNEATCPGIKKGGVLNVVRYEVELVCTPTAIPATIKIDLAAAEVGDSLHISAVKLPRGVTPAITDRDFTVATIAAPSGSKADEEEAAEGEAEA